MPYSYLIELRPKNTATGYGFLLPEREIPATGLETFEAIKVVAEEMVGQFVQPEIRKIAGELRKLINMRDLGSNKPTLVPSRRGYQIIETTTKENKEIETSTGEKGE